MRPGNCRISRWFQNIRPWWDSGAPLPRISGWRRSSQRFVKANRLSAISPCRFTTSRSVGKSAFVPCSFFERDPLVCARELVGTELAWGKCSGIIVETEAYLTLNDEACHTFTRPSTRAFVERNEPGAIYIYFNYGVHWMLNLLVKGGPRTGLILIRALEPRRGLALMKKRRGVEDVRRICSGPGKLTQALDITNRHHERSICAGPCHCL